MEFNPGFDIEVTTNPMGFKYGKNVLGPVVENRKLDAIRKSLLDPNSDGPDIVYTIAMDVCKAEHMPLLKEMGLLYGVVTYAQGRIGKEPVRSQGHIHSFTAKNGWSTPEVYEIWSGEAIIYMQETAKDNPGRCFAVKAGPGEVVIVPPGWAHATISADPNQPLTFGAWCVRNFGFDYDDVRGHKGLAWFPVLKEDGEIEWHRNPNYEESTLVQKSPEIYKQFDIEPGKAIYKQFEEQPEKFKFVVEPEIAKEKWVDFLP